MNALVWLLVGLSSLTPSGFPEPASVVRAAQAAPTREGDLRAGVRSLRVAIEVRRGYDRDLFRHWVDRDSDGCDTRDEVLIAEATTGPRSWSWFSPTPTWTAVSRAGPLWEWCRWRSC